MIPQKIINLLAIFGGIALYVLIGWATCYYICWLIDDDDYFGLNSFSEMFFMCCFTIIILPISIIITIFIIFKNIIEIPSKLKKLDKLENIEAEIKKLNRKRNTKK